MTDTEKKIEKDRINTHVGYGVFVTLGLLGGGVFGSGLSNWFIFLAPIGAVFIVFVAVLITNIVTRSQL